jgi:hypothetical protein
MIKMDNVDANEQEVEAVCSDELKEWIKKEQIQLIRYDEIN